jgi:hypothetical protein
MNSKAGSDYSILRSSGVSKTTRVGSVNGNTAIEIIICTGVRLGWSIVGVTSQNENRKNQRVEVYRQSQDVQVLEAPPELSGEDVLPGFVLNMDVAW